MTHALVLLLLAGCPRDPTPTGPDVRPEVTLERARARSIPDPVRTRLRLHAEAPLLDISGATGGGLLLDRPGLFRLEVFHPVSGRLLVLWSDGEALGLLQPPASRHVIAAHADQVLTEVTGGMLDMDDFLGLLVGDLPLDDAPVGEIVREDEQVVVTLDGPRDTTLRAWLEADRAVPLRVEATDADGLLLARVDYPDWVRVQGRWMPAALTVEIPALTATVELLVDAWDVPQELPDGAFTVETPAGYTEEALETAAPAWLLRDPPSTGETVHEE